MSNTYTMLGRYRILGELGRGAMGTVYRALDPLIDREVAIKTLHPNLPEEVAAEVRERFVREAKSAGRLNHPNIVTIYDVGEHDGVAYIAMELLEGRTLQAILREPERLPFPMIADLAAQIADALDIAQQLGIVHRDVKPANVVVSAAGRAKLTDFGVAYVPSSTMTQTGTALGSPRYMSPEQVLGLPIDPRSDIFSLGVVLYEMLTRRTPFDRPEDSTIFPLMHRIAGEPHPPVTQLDPSIPAAFDVILRKALAKKPEERYQRAGDMARDLRDLRSFGPSGPARAQADDEKTQVLARGLRSEAANYEKTVAVPTAARTAAAATPEAAETGKQLIADLETFSRNFEKEAQARLRAEAEARRNKEAELQRWAALEARKREEFERQREGGSVPAGGQDTGSRRAALDLLKEQSAVRPRVEDTAAKKAAADAGLDRSMRSAFQYLAEFARELNGINPASGRPYEFIYLGRLPAVTLAEAFADLRSRKINGKEHADQLIFRFKVQLTMPAKATVLGADISRLQQYLQALKVPFDVKPEAKNDFGQVTRAAFTVSAPLPCAVDIRADYDTASVVIQLVNVRRPGRVQCRMEPKALDDVVDDLARYVLGADDDFDRVLDRR